MDWLEGVYMAELGFCLSEHYDTDEGIVYHEEDVKEFIRLLKSSLINQKDMPDGIMVYSTDILNAIDKLAGEKLI
jgi:hypothetical protein